jgi:hypothetical protein
VTSADTLHWPLKESMLHMSTSRTMTRCSKVRQNFCPPARPHENLQLPDAIHKQAVTLSSSTQQAQRGDTLNKGVWGRYICGHFPSSNSAVKVDRWIQHRFDPRSNPLGNGLIRWAINVDRWVFNGCLFRLARSLRGHVNTRFGVKWVISKSKSRS